MAPGVNVQTNEEMYGLAPLTKVTVEVLGDPRVPAADTFANQGPPPPNFQDGGVPPPPVEEAAPKSSEPTDVVEVGFGGDEKPAEDGDAPADKAANDAAPADTASDEAATDDAAPADEGSDATIKANANLEVEVTADVPKDDSLEVWIDKPEGA